MLDYVPKLGPEACQYHRSRVTATPHVRRSQIILLAAASRVISCDEGTERKGKKSGVVQTVLPLGRKLKKYMRGTGLKTRRYFSSIFRSLAYIVLSLSL